MSKLTAAVVITTRNRKDELLKAVASALEQRGSGEVLVMDDGSSDGTEGVVAEMMKSRKAGKLKGAKERSGPELRVVRHEESKGYIVRRNEAAHLVKADVIFSLDDDAVFSSPQVVEQTLRDFSHPRIGAVAIPYIEPHKMNREMQRAPTREDVWITASYIGTAHAVRRDVFLALGGYREHLVHQGEEGDFCIRMLAADAAEMLKSEKLKAEREEDRRWEIADRGERGGAESFAVAGSEWRVKSKDKGSKAGGQGSEQFEAEVPGFFVRLGNSDPIIHNESPKRDYRRMDFYGRRNDILFHWQNTPLPDLLWAISATIVGGLACAARTGRWGQMLQGIAVGLRQAPRHRRCPLTIKVFRAFKRLKQSRTEKI